MLNCYKVKVNCTNSSNDTFFVLKDKSRPRGLDNNDGEYKKCEEKICYVITDDASKIYQEFGDRVVVSVEKIGIGYCV